MTTEQTADPASTEQAKILIVDDVAKNIQVLGSVLRDQGYQVIPATSGQQALRAAETHRPDLILLDVMMPEMNGHEVIVKLREDPALADIPVIFITALTDNEDEAKGLNLGAVDYITKPINIPITLARVRTHLSLRLAQRRLEEQNRQLIEAARLREDVERMSRHDLKTPLSVIIATPDLVLMNDKLEPDQIELLKMIKQSGYRMLNMIDRSLDLYKMETGVYQFRPEAMDLVKAVRRVFEDSRDAASRHKIALHIRIDGDEAADDATFEVTGEELLCYSMLANLVKNAVEASPENAPVTVSLERGSPNVVSVHNQGVVPEEIRDRFFEKYTTAGKATGTGLGTYSARLIAETHGGSVHLETREETGTTVSVHLP
jgi:CheY-like chemotaxis protein